MNMANTMRWGVEDEDEYKDEYEFPVGLRGTGYYQLIPLS